MIRPARSRLWGSYLDEVAVHSDPGKRFPPPGDLNDIIQAHAFKTYGQDNSLKRTSGQAFQGMLKRLRRKYRKDPSMDLGSPEFFTRLATASRRWWESKGQAEYEKLMDERKAKWRKNKASRKVQNKKRKEYAARQAARAANPWESDDPLFDAVQDVITGNTWEGEYARSVLGERRAQRKAAKLSKGAKVEVAATRGQDKPFHGMKGKVVEVRSHFVTVSFPALGDIQLFPDSLRQVEDTELEGWPSWVRLEDIEAAGVDTGYQE